MSPEQASMAESAGDVVFRVDQSDIDSDIWDDSALIKAYDKAISSVKGMTKDGSDDKNGKNKQKRKRGGKKKKKAPPQSKWRRGDRCRCIFTEDEQVYSAVITSVNPMKSSCLVKYVGYGNEEEKRLSDLFTESEAETPSNFNSKAPQENGYDSMEWTDHSQSPRHPSSGGPRKRAQHHTPPLHYPPHPQSYPPPPPTGLPPPHSQPSGYPGPYGGPSWFAPPPPPPPPPMMSPLPFAPWGSPNPHLFQGWGEATPHTSQTPNRIPPFPSSPPHPPLPVDVEDMDKEALHSMLMAWYMSGFHTGYYQGLKRAQSSDKTTSKTKDDNVASPDLSKARRTKSKTKASTVEQSTCTSPLEADTPVLCDVEQESQET